MVHSILLKLMCIYAQYKLFLSAFSMLPHCEVTGDPCLRALIDGPYQRAMGVCTTYGHIYFVGDGDGNSKTA